jgi:prophage regulatory protein
MSQPSDAQALPRQHLYSLRDVVRMTGLSRTTIWRAERGGHFPRRRQLTPGRVGWLASEVEAWMSARTQARTGTDAASNRPVAADQDRTREP